MNEKKSKLKTAIATAITVACTTFAVNFFAPKTTLSDADIEKEVKKSNKDLPMQMDETMRLDSITNPSSKLIYYYITADVYKEEANFDTIRKYINPSLLENIKTNSELKLFRKSDVTWKYLFNDINGDYFYEYIITPEMYK